MDWDFLFKGPAGFKTTKQWQVHGEEEDIRRLWVLIANFYPNSYFIVIDGKGNIRNQ